MPNFTRRHRPYARRKRRYGRNPPRKPAGIATRPRMMPRSLAVKRFNQVSTKVFWFKKNGLIQPDLAGKIYSFWTTHQFDASPPTGWAQLRQLYDQYKVLAIKVRWFPANVGIEPDSALFASNALLRGNTAVWSDQRYDPLAAAPTTISDIINNASTRIINSRLPYSRVLYRATGNPEWAQTQGPNTVDSWNGSIEMLTTDATPAPAGGTAPTLWFYTVQYKIVVRGRTQV